MNERRVRPLGAHGQLETGFGSKGVKTDVDTNGVGTAGDDPVQPLVEGEGLKRVRLGSEDREVPQGVLGLDAMIDVKAVEKLRGRFRGCARPVDEPGRFVEIYPTGPSSGAVTTARPDGSVLAGRAPGQAERLSPLLTFASALIRTLCAS
jgi:hypothetical protein